MAAINLVAHGASAETLFGIHAAGNQNSEGHIQSNRTEVDARQTMDWWDDVAGNVPKWPVVRCARSWMGSIVDTANLIVDGPFAALNYRF